MTKFNNTFKSSFCVLGTQKLLETAGNKFTIVIDGYLILTDVDGNDHHVKIARKGNFVNWRNADYFKVVHESGGDATITTTSVYTAVWSDILETNLPLWEKTSEEVSIKGVVVKRWSLTDDVLWYEENERPHRPRRARWNDIPWQSVSQQDIEDKPAVYRHICVECGVVKLGKPTHISVSTLNAFEDKEAADYDDETGIFILERSVVCTTCENEQLLYEQEQQPHSQQTIESN